VGVLCTALFGLTGFAREAAADYGERAKAELAAHQKGDLDFAEAKVLQQVHRNTREGTIARLAGTVKELLSRSSESQTESFEPGEVARLRTVAPLRGRRVVITEEQERAALIDASGELSVREMEDSTEISRTGVFSLRVFADGDAFRFRNHLADVASNGHRPFRLDERQAEVVGRALIEELELVPKDEGSQLEFLKTRYVHFTGAGGDLGDRVVATEIYFGRRIGGIPVIGPRGSLVKLELAGKHITSLSVDWASYQSPTRDALVQKPVAMDTVEERLQRHLGLLRSRPSQGVTVESRICGYVDPGNRQHNDNVLQLGCLLTYRGNSTSQVALIPLAQTPVRDSRWDATEDTVSPGTNLLSVADVGEPTAGASEPGSERAEGSCSVGRQGSAATWGTLGLGGLCAWLILSRRRRQGRRTGLSGSLVAVGLLSAGSAEAVQNVLDFNTYMIKDYTAGTCDDFDSAQWANFDDWVDEMADESDSHDSVKNPNDLGLLLVGGLRGIGYNADLVAVATHGREEYVGGVHHGYFRDRACNLHDMNAMEPLDGEMEIMLLHMCDVYTRNNYDNWTTFRNLHRYGAPVSAGCWGICWLSNMGYNTTFNEVGDELADEHSSVYYAWSNGHSVGYRDDDIVVLGLGTYGSGSCATAARKAGFHNRMSYEGPQYASNRPHPVNTGDPELCGYTWDNQ